MGNFTSLTTRTACRDWASLPDDLVAAIAERLPLPNHAQFRAVCSSWATTRASPSSSHFPWLMLDRDGTHRSFLNVDDDATYRFGPTDAGTCVGSRNGRLVILDGTNSKATVINPITGLRINLPAFDTLPFTKSFYDVRKVAVSDTDFAIAVVYSLSCCHLAFAAPGDAAWTPLEFVSPPSQKIEDVIYHDNKFFVVFTRGRVQCFELTNGKIPVALRLNGTDTDTDTTRSSHNVYLVSCSGALLQVRRERELVTGRTTKFRVTKFDADSGWVEIKELGDYTLFVDAKGSMSMYAKDVKNVTRNCIYYADEVPHCGRTKVGDLKTYDMTRGIVEPLRVCNDGDVKLMSPIWFSPCLL